jgi:hypothetical protein
MAMSFEQWKSQVDSMVYDYLECHLDDLEDENYRVNYEAGITVDLMARIVINNNSFISETPSRMIS